MFWRVICEKAEEVNADSVEAAGRFVLHRHRDADGPHLDLRLEHGDCLMGWRVASEALEGESWATEKAPHPLHWLDTDGDAVREDAGTYAWVDREDGERAVLLSGKTGARLVRVAPIAGIPMNALRAVCETLAELDVEPGSAAGLIVDGHVARQRAFARFCGLGRELDGDAFDEDLWRKTLDGLSLDEIQTYLRAYEVRFDRKYPPVPVSRPERLPEADEETAGDREGVALAIMRE